MMTLQQVNERIGDVFTYQGRPHRVMALQNDLNGQFWVALARTDDPEFQELITIEDFVQSQATPAARPG